MCVNNDSRRLGCVANMKGGLKRNAVPFFSRRGIHLVRHLERLSCLPTQSFLGWGISINFWSVRTYSWERWRWHCRSICFIIMFSDQCPLLPKFLFVADKQFRSEDALRRSISNGEFISADVPKISSYGIEMKCINVAKISVKCKIYNLAAVCVYVCSRLVEILKNLIKN